MSALDSAVEMAMETPPLEVLVNFALFGLFVMWWLLSLVTVAFVVLKFADWLRQCP